MQVGKLRHRIDVYGKTKVTNELNQKSYIDAKISTIWAEIIPQTGTMQRQQVETMLTNVTHKIICRYSQKIIDAYQQLQTKSDMHIIFKGHRFNITYIMNPYFRNETMEIFAEEVIG